MSGNTITIEGIFINGSDSRASKCWRICAKFNLTDAVAKSVSNIQIATTINGNALRTAQLCIDRGTAVAIIITTTVIITTKSTRTGYCTDNTACIYFTDAVVILISNIQIATAIDGDTCRIGKSGTGRRTAVTMITKSPDTRDRTNDTVCTHFTDTMILRVSNIQITTAINSNTIRIVK